MRDHSHHIELSREEAVAAMLERSNAWQGFFGEQRVEQVSVTEAYGRVVAEDITSCAETPNCLTCGMDSIAVHWKDFENGMPDTSSWKRGVDWEFANTGVAMPEGFDTAIVIEHVQVSDDAQHVSISAAPSKQYAGTRPAGSKLKVGDILAHAGDVITPDVAARIAEGNLSAVPVVRKPRVAFIPTGDELVPPGAGRVAHGCNIETNSILARGKVEAWGGVFQLYDVVLDNPQTIRETLLKAVKTADIVVLNAGSSKGSGDWAVEQLEELGEIICHQTNHGPGHHSSYAVLNNTPIVGISGPPMGASFTLNFYLRPIMRKFLGLEPEIDRIPARLAKPFPQKGPHRHKEKDGEKSKKVQGEERPFTQMEPGKVFYGVRFLTVQMAEDGSLEAFPVVGPPGSPAMEAANAYFMMPNGPGVENPKEGDIIKIELR